MDAMDVMDAIDAIDAVDVSWIIADKLGFSSTRTS